MAIARVATRLFGQAIAVPRVVVAATGVALFVVVTAIGAQVRIPLPFTPVPVTGQTFFVILSGLTLGSRLGGTTQLLYVLLGITGLPFFSGGKGGWSILAGPTGGYLVGFVLAAWLAGHFARPRKNLFTTVGALGLASLSILLLGTFWLGISLHLSPAAAIQQGLLPFLVGDALKVLVASGLFRLYHRRAKEFFPR